MPQGKLWTRARLESPVGNQPLVPRMIPPSWTSPQLRRRHLLVPLRRHLVPPWRLWWQLPLMFVHLPQPWRRPRRFSCWYSALMQ